MTDPMPQSYANHRRYDPWYHVVLLGILVVNLGLVIWNVFRFRQPMALWGVVMAGAWAIVYIKMRSFALTAQDRLIRLEETLRMERLLPAELKERIGELRRGQFVALRFASDGELGDRVKEALDQRLGAGEIKKRIVSWRADHFRV